MQGGKSFPLHTLAVLTTLSAQVIQQSKVYNSNLAALYGNTNGSTITDIGSCCNKREKSGVLDSPRPCDETDRLSSKPNPTTAPVAPTSPNIIGGHHYSPTNNSGADGHASRGVRQQSTHYDTKLV